MTRKEVSTNEVRPGTQTQAGLSGAVSEKQIGIRFFSGRNRYPFPVLAALVFGLQFGLAAKRPESLPYPDLGQQLIPADVDWANPLYQTAFDDASVS